MRDITLGDTIHLDFTTRALTGIPTVLAGTPVLSVLEENNATPITAGVSVSVDRASVVGLNMATVVATGGNGYEAGKGYSVYISTGTVNSVSVIGEIVAQFTIEANPVNWAKVTAPTTAVDLSATDFQLADTVTTLTNKTGFSLSTAGILAIWDQLTSALTTASTIGKLLVDNINATISSRGTGDATIANQTSIEGKVDTINTTTAATKVTTDKFVFTVTNQVDGNMKSINNATVTGDGDGTPWDGI